MNPPVSAFNIVRSWVAPLIEAVQSSLLAIMPVPVVHGVGILAVLSILYVINIRLKWLAQDTLYRRTGMSDRSRFGIHFVGMLLLVVLLSAAVVEWIVQSP